MDVAFLAHTSEICDLITRVVVSTVIAGDADGLLGVHFKSATT
jgi:hypothetical protein